MPEIVRAWRFPGVRGLHPAFVVDEPPTTTRLAALLRSLDDLLAEAEHLRLEISAAVLRRSASPFWPDRRRVNIPYDPDRRRP
jgi:hypothetical protein